MPAGAGTVDACSWANHEREYNTRIRRTSRSSRKRNTWEVEVTAVDFALLQAQPERLAQVIAPRTGVVLDHLLPSFDPRLSAPHTLHKRTSRLPSHALRPCGCVLCKQIAAAIVVVRPREAISKDGVGGRWTLTRSRFAPVFVMLLCDK